MPSADGVPGVAKRNWPSCSPSSSSARFQRAAVALAFSLNACSYSLAASEKCPYALGASVFGQPTTAGAFARKIKAGVVVINDNIVPTADPANPEKLRFSKIPGIEPPPPREPEHATT